MKDCTDNYFIYLLGKEARMCQSDAICNGQILTFAVAMFQ